MNAQNQTPVIMNPFYLPLTLDNPKAIQIMAARMVTKVLKKDASPDGDRRYKQSFGRVPLSQDVDDLRSAAALAMVEALQRGDDLKDVYTFGWRAINATLYAERGGQVRIEEISHYDENGNPVYVRHLVNRIFTTDNETLRNLIDMRGEVVDVADMAENDENETPLQTAIRDIIQNELTTRQAFAAYYLALRASCGYSLGVEPSDLLDDTEWDESMAGMSVREFARKIGVSDKTAREHIDRARAAIVRGLVKRGLSECLHGLPVGEVLDCINKY